MQHLSAHGRYELIVQYLAGDLFMRRRGKTTNGRVSSIHIRGNTPSEDRARHVVAMKGRICWTESTSNHEHAQALLALEERT